MSYSFGLSDTVLSWFKAYLSKRTQQVLFNDMLSTVETVSFGVPQGSVLGPLLFLLYTADVFDVVEKYGYKCYAYADDLQIVVNCPAILFNDAVDLFCGCLVEVGDWLSSNRLKLNQAKTQLLPVGTWQQLSELNCKYVEKLYSFL